MTIMKSKELLRIEKFINEGKHDTTLQLMTDFEEKGETSSREKLSYQLLKCNFLFQQGKYADVIKLAEQTYKESLGLGKNLLSIDALMLMPHPLLWLLKLDKAFDTIKQGEELLKALTQELPTEYKQREADIAYYKAKLYFWGKNEIDLALEQAERGLTLREEYGSKQQISQSLIQLGWIISNGKGELDRALKYVKRALTLAEESNNKYNVAESLNTIGIIYNLKGELDHNIIFLGQSMAIFKELNNKRGEARVLNNLGYTYRMRGEFDNALDCLEQSLALFSEMGNLFNVANAHDYLIQILVEKGDFRRAKQYLHDLEQINNKMKDQRINFIYLFCKAYILKNSSRTRDRGKAEEIFKQLLKEEDLKYEDNIRILLILCELLLIELHMTNDIEVLSELEPIITQLIAIAEKSHSFWILGETYLFQAKLALITLDLKKTRRLLTQGQQIAEKYSLTLLAMKISHEHDNLFKKIGKWEDFKQTKASLEERMKLARLNEQLEGMVNKRVVEPIDLIDEEPVVLLIVSKQGIPVFSQSFEEEWSFQDHLFGGFLSAVNSFSDEMFSEGLDRATFGQYTILMKSIPPFSVCYLFKGQTYPAQQKIKYFTERILNEKKIWQTLHEFYRTNREIQLKDIPSLEPLLTDIFINKNLPSNRLESII